jgi:hypothetical protein
VRVDQILDLDEDGAAESIHERLLGCYKLGTGSATIMPNSTSDFGLRMLRCR